MNAKTNTYAFSGFTERIPTRIKKAVLVLVIPNRLKNVTFFINALRIRTRYHDTKRPKFKDWYQYQRL